MSAFATSGSNVTNPQAGLNANMSKPTSGYGLISGALGSSGSSYQPPVGGPKLNSNPFGNPNSGVIGAINSATGTSPQGGMSVAPTTIGTTPGILPNFNAGNGYGTINPASTTTATGAGTGSGGTGTSTAVPTTDNVQNGVDLTKYAGLMAANNQTAGGTPITPPVNTSGTDFSGNLVNTVNSGAQTGNEAQTQTGLINSAQYTPQENSEIQQLNQNQETYGLQSNNNSLALPTVYSNGRNAILANQYSNEQQAGEGALANMLAQQNLGVTAAQGAYSGAQNQAARATQANETTAGLTAPTQVSPGNTEVFPATQQAGYGMGSTTGNGSNALQNYTNAQNNNAQAVTYSNTAKALQTGASQVGQYAQQFQSAIAAGGLNPTAFPTVNAFYNALDSQFGGAGNTSAAAEAFNNLKSTLSSMINASTGLTPTDVTSMLNGQSLSTLSPSQFYQAWPTIQATLNTKISTNQTLANQYENSGTTLNNGSSATPAAPQNSPDWNNVKG